MKYWLNARLKRPFFPFASSKEAPPQYLYQDRKLLVPVVCFAKLVYGPFFRLCKMLRTLDFCLNQPRGNQMYQKQKSS